ncbi:MAG: cytochrome c biogenesis protein CcsA [Candidatus Hydrogenedentota bacterium]
MRRRFTTSIVCATILAAGFLTNTAHAASAHSAGQWTDETIALVSEIPILDGGRIKPLDTFAQFKMLRINGKRSYQPLDAEGNKTKRSEKMGPVEWLLDCMFYPEQAADYPVFIIDDANVVTTLGIEQHTKQRDRYSYNELKGASQDLLGRAQSASRLEPADQSYQQKVMIALWGSFYELDILIHYLDFARETYPVADSAVVRRVMNIDADAELTLADLLRNFRGLQNGIRALQQVVEENGAEDYQHEVDAMEAFFYPLLMAEATSMSMRLIPPANPEDKDWLTPSDMTKSTLNNVPSAESELAILASLDRLADKVDDKMAFSFELHTFHDLVIAQAEAREEYSMIRLERSYYNAQLVYRAQIIFIFSFILAALSWLSLKNKWLTRATVVAVVVPLLMLITAITLRCIIRGRPPVSTLYETVLFITAVCVAVALFIEYINRQKIGLSVAAFLGALGLFIAGRYEITNQQDTMPSLVAVLDTNFWLATHVTIINIGYAAGMLAAGISHVYILGRLFKRKQNDPKFYRGITRMVYGVTCFGLLFAFVGTVLGGIWANYSWGRFWGWDPKENGAALIVVCQLAILHARNGGYIKQMGIHIAALFTGCVVGFSWWGVNLLGVGLHSYGFTEGIWNATFTFWGVETFIMLLGFLVLFRDRKRPTAPEQQAADDAKLVAAK